MKIDETKLNMNPMKVENGKYIWDNALWEEYKHTAQQPENLELIK